MPIDVQRDRFRVIDASWWQAVRDEQLGSKEKLWLREPADAGGRQWLFKYPQTDETGDDWAERVVAAIADELGVPHAETELATRKGKVGVLSLDLTEGGKRGELVLGNDLLFERDPAYPRAEHRSRSSKYSLDAVLEVLDQEFIRAPAHSLPGDGVRSTLDVFIGYLMLDALVANQDRHHENWGVLQRRPVSGERVAELSPSFDHASSLARGDQDSSRSRRLRTNVLAHGIDAYCLRARSLFVTAADPRRRLGTFEAFEVAGRRSPAARAAWLEHLEAVDDAMLEACVTRVPDDRMSATAKEFSWRMLESNRRRLLASERA